MRNDLYTKIILTVIAVCLAVVGWNSCARPQIVAADGPLSGVQFFGVGSGLLAVDTRTGDVWVYPLAENTRSVERVGKIVKLGQPMAK